ncbi:MAG: MFS transporter [Candidatus Omnitrophica bacterium]|nr:MFS transporter [Candidatus Omnitrophota bacterium]MCM8799230.1 MFS transporter [Candidatus Omnitrophota bacterium]
MKKKLLILAWALYDLANQFFAVNIVSLYFVRWITIERNVAEIFYSIFYSISTFLVAVSSPILGGISDFSQRRKPFLVYLTLLSIIFTLLLSSTDNVFLALIFFAIANFGCQTAVIFYNAIMVEFADSKDITVISGIGRAFGYIGAILAIYLVKDPIIDYGYRFGFLLTAILFLVFSLPCLLFIKDSSKENIDFFSFFKKERIISVFKRIRQLFNHCRKNPYLANFLKASFLGLCVVNAVIVFMSVYASRVFGLNEDELSKLIVFSTLFAILGSFSSGYLCKYLGYRRSLIIIFFLWMVSLVAASLIRTKTLFWLIGALVGLSLSSSWVISRAFLVKVSKKEDIGEIFGLFNFIGYLSTILGSLFLGISFLILIIFKEYGYRLSIFNLNIFLVFGLIFLLRLPKDI